MSIARAVDASRLTWAPCREEDVELLEPDVQNSRERSAKLVILHERDHLGLKPRTDVEPSERPEIQSEVRSSQ